MIATKVLAELEAEAKERRASTLKQNTDSQKFDEREEGRATDKAAKLTGTNRQYVSDAKRLTAEAPELAEKVSRPPQPPRPASEAGIRTIPHRARRGRRMDSVAFCVDWALGRR